VKVLFDTNVLLAAFLTDGICAKLLTRARKRRFDLFLCPRILNEFKRILSKKFKAGREETAAAVALLHEAVQTMVKPDTAVHDVCRDPNDAVDDVGRLKVLFQGCPDLIGRGSTGISVGVNDRQPGFMRPALISAPVHCHQPGSVGPLSPEYQQHLSRIAIPAKSMKSGPKVTPFFARHGIAKPRDPGA
jgi:putative PIN family toxin of toxin-antitoxin system